MPKLTKRTVDSLKPSQKDRVVWDEQIPGFGLRIKPSGQKSFVLQYRNAHHRTKRKTIGRYGLITPDQARSDALRLKVEINEGNDPVAAQKATRKAPKVNDLMESYLTEHVSIHNKRTTQERAKLFVKRFINPQLGDLLVEKVTRQDVAQLHLKMQNTKAQANIVLAILSKAFNLAEDWGWRDENTNPTLKIKRYPEVKRERYLTTDELRILGETLANADREQTEQPTVTTVIRLLALTGCRLSEVLTLKWSYLDLEQGTLNLPDAKAGARSQPLPRAALEILHKLPRRRDMEWVLPNQTRTGHIDKSNMERAWRRIRQRSGLNDVRMHDLRHTVGTYAGNSGANAFMVRDLLGHKTIAMTNRYVGRNIDPQRRLVNDVANEISSAMDGN